MADNQSGTGAPGKQNKSEGQGKTETGNHTKLLQTTGQNR